MTGVFASVWMSWQVAFFEIHATSMEQGSGRFVESPEYLEFPWIECIINAVARRDYAASGRFFKVSMYDDRLEIESPE